MALVSTLSEKLAREEPDDPVVMELRQCRLWAARAGLEFLSDGPRAPARHLRPEEITPFVYGEVFRLLSSPAGARPDAIYTPFVDAAPGIVLAVLASLAAGAGGPSMKIPRLVLAANAELPLICPLPARFVMVSARDYAGALMEQVLDRRLGRPVKRRLVECALRRHDPATADGAPFRGVVSGPFPGGGRLGSCRSVRPRGWGCRRRTSRRRRRN